MSADRRAAGTSRCAAVFSPIGTAAEPAGSCSRGTAARAAEEGRLRCSGRLGDVGLLARLLALDGAMYALHRSHVRCLAYRRQRLALGHLAIQPLGVVALAVVRPRPHVVDEGVAQHEARRIADLQHRLHEGSDGGQDGLPWRDCDGRLRVLLRHVGVHDELLARAAVAQPLAVAARGAPLVGTVRVRIKFPVLARVDLGCLDLGNDRLAVRGHAGLVRMALSLGDEAHRTLVALVR